jgi:hypothetical protein
MRKLDRVVSQEQLDEIIRQLAPQDPPACMPEGQRKEYMMREMQTIRDADHRYRLRIRQKADRGEKLTPLERKALLYPMSNPTTSVVEPVERSRSSNEKNSNGSNKTPDRLPIADVVYVFLKFVLPPLFIVGYAAVHWADGGWIPLIYFSPVIVLVLVGIWRVFR